jgi:hypothetical protein
MKTLDFRPESSMLTAWCIMPHEFNEIADDLRSDGALRDFYIRAANRADWNAVLRRVRSNRKADCFTVDGESRALPQSFEAIEHLRQKANPCLSILVDGGYVNCHFFGHEEIEFDFRPEDFRTPERWSSLCGFFQQIVDVVGKSGVITHENAEDCVIDRFEPRTKLEQSVAPKSGSDPLPGISGIIETPPTDMK